VPTFDEFEPPAAPTAPKPEAKTAPEIAEPEAKVKSSKPSSTPPPVEAEPVEPAATTEVDLDSLEPHPSASPRTKSQFTELKVPRSRQRRGEGVETPGADSEGTWLRLPEDPKPGSKVMDDFATNVKSWEATKMAPEIEQKLGVLRQRAGRIQKPRLVMNRQQEFQFAAKHGSGQGSRKNFGNCSSSGKILRAGVELRARDRDDLLRPLGQPVGRIDSLPSMKPPEPPTAANL